MTVKSISAVTLAVSDMGKSVAFYSDQIGMELLYGGLHSEFSSFGIGGSYLNLIVTKDSQIEWWGRLIFYVDDVDALHSRLISNGVATLTSPEDASWNERYFHVCDPDGHELSFARPL